MKTTFFAVVLIALGWGCAVAQVPAIVDPAAVEPPRRNVTIEGRCVGLAYHLATPIIAKLKSPDPAERARGVAEIMALLGAGQAQLFGWPMVTTFEGQRAVVEGNEEVRYATQFEPGSINLYQVDRESKAATELPKQSGLAFASTPTSFETRNTGVTLEVEPAVWPGGKWIGMNFVLQHTRLKAMDRVTVQREQAGKDGKDQVTVEVPRFTSFRVTTSLALESGDHQLVGIFPMPEDAQQVELFLLSAEVEKSR